MNYFRAFLVAISFALFSMHALTQPATGTYPYGSFTGGPDVVNLGNLNANLTIPIVNKAGRGRNFVYNLTYDSSVWYPVGSSGSQSWQPVGGSWGWNGLNPVGIVYASYTVSTSGGTCGQYGQNTWQQWQYGNVSLFDQNGTHTFTSAGGVYISTNGSSACPPNGAQPPQQITTPASDGSGITLTFQVTQSGLSISFNTKSGAAIYPPIFQNSNPTGNPSSSVDNNGNVISNNGDGVFTDTLGQQALSVFGTAPSNTTLTYTNPVGNPVADTVSYTSYNIKTNFGCSGISEYSASNVNLVTQVSLPDGRSYQFTYENTPGYSGYTTGRVASVTLPTGGTISYAYTGGSNGIECADGSAAGLTRTTPDGTWTYARSGSGTQWSTTVTAPTYNSAQNQTVSKFLTNGATSSANFYEIERQLYAGSASSGTLLETLLTCYEAISTNCSSSIGDSGTSVSSSALSRIQKTTQLPGGSGTISSGTLDTYDTFGNDTSHAVYDFASGTSYGNLLQTTTTWYTTFYGGDLPTEVRVTDAGSNIVADTLYGYGATIVATTGTPQHVSNYNVGDIASVTKFVSAGTWQTTAYTYFDTGNVDVATDVNGEQTTYTYGSGTSCGNSFPTSVSSTTGGSVVTSLTTSATWNCVGGVQLTSTDVNGNFITYGYGSDPYWRVVSAVNNATGAVTYNYGYPTATRNHSYTSMSFNGSTPTSTNTTDTEYDGLGRTVLYQVQQVYGAGNYDITDTTYDSLGRVATQTLPYSAAFLTYTPTNPGTTTTYDALNRKTQVADSGGGTKTYAYSQNDVLVTIGPVVTTPGTENLKKRNLEHNGAGWLTSVCEVVASTLPAGGACGQTSSYTGYLTKYTYDGGGRLTQTKQNAQSSSVQSRTVVYDDLGRKTSETIPEWSAGTGSAGTTNYYYDSVSGCTSSTGDLIKTVDPIGNTTCITYDLLHRPTSSQVISGSYASVTPATVAVYDAATYSGTAMQNAKGQVAEASTCTTLSCTTKLTDIYFSASPVTSGNMAGGVLAQMWESTLHSSSYFLTQDTYFPNGALGAISASLGGASIGIPNLTFNVDGEGRPYSATDTTHSLNLVTATAYNAATLPTSITYGNAATGGSNDVDTFGYDSMDRPASLEYWLEPTAGEYEFETSLTWNANGSLQQMAYLDPYDSTKNQTCNYSADDLSRIASTSCGTSTWGQTFSYDPFGNIKKTVPGGYSGTPYAAAYSTVTNQVSSGVTPAATYDANGNQLTSTPASLTWNALNQPVTVNTTTATYDAMGRMAEKYVGGVYTQFVYRPSGDKLAVYRSSLAQGLIPLPGGSTAVYNASGLNYIRHKDWLGSSRLATTWAHAVYSKEAYAPFGETYNEAGTADRSFTGQDQNVATGSGGSGEYDFLFRKYDPSAGRWLSPDPLGWGAVTQADPQSLNRYAYVENQPMNATDPNGLMLCISNTVSSDGKIYGYDSGDAPCAAGYWAYQAPTETVVVNGDADTCSDSNASACAPTQNPGNQNPGNPNAGNQNAPSNGLPTPTNHKLTIPGTNYCGPGGNGTPTNQVDAACAAHDACYQNAGVSWRNNVPFGPSMNAAQAGAIQACNANLCSSLSNMSWPSSSEAGQATLVSTFFGCSGGYSLR